MSWKNEALTYIDQEGLFAPAPYPESKWTGGNMLKDTALYYLMLGLLGQLTEEDKEKYAKAVRDCYVPGKIGLLNRNKGRANQQAHDDYVAVMSAETYTTTGVAQEIANNNKGYRDNEADGKIYWGGFFFRFIYVPALFNVVSSGRSGWLDMLRLYIHFKFLAKGDESDLILYWMLAQACLKMNVLTGLVKSWLAQHDFSEIFKHYYGESHIFTKYFYL